MRKRKPRQSQKFQVLGPAVVDFTLHRATTLGYELPTFEIGDTVHDRQTGDRARVFDIVKVGHAGQPLVVRLFARGAMRTVAVNRLILADPPSRAPEPECA